LAGCGGGGSSTGGWQILDKGTFSSKESAYLHTTLGRPAQVELKVEASPNVTTATSYSIACGANENVSTNRQGPAGRTPVRGPLLVPEGPPGGCYVNVLATKSKPASMTLTLLTRALPG